MQYLALAAVLILSIGLVVAATIGAGVGGAIVSVSFLAMVWMGVLSPGRLPRTGREHETPRLACGAAVAPPPPIPPGPGPRAGPPPPEQDPGPARRGADRLISG